jgi:hypothetical protein
MPSEAAAPLRKLSRSSRSPRCNLGASGDEGLGAWGIPVKSGSAFFQWVDHELHPWPTPWPIQMLVYTAHSPQGHRPPRR